MIYPNSTKPQRWARKRNWAKGLVMCMISIISTMIHKSHSPKYLESPLCSHEKATLNSILSNLEMLRDNWDENNKESKIKYIGEGE